jgi:hypothetical protein
MTDLRGDEGENGDGERPADPPARPKRPNVILEDIDAIETRRLKLRGRKYGLRDLFTKAGPDDPRVYRRLSSFGPTTARCCWPSRSRPRAAATLGQVFVMGIHALAHPARRRGVSLLAREMQVAAPASTPPASVAGRDVGLPAPCWPTSAAAGGTPSAARAAGWAGVALVVLVHRERQPLRAAPHHAHHLRWSWSSRCARRSSTGSWLSMRFYQANHSGKLLSRLTNDLNNLGALLVDVMVDPRPTPWCSSARSSACTCRAAAS